MLYQPIFLFLGGIDIPSLVIIFVILAIPGFFIWRALLKFLVKKGPRGINIAAIIMGVVQSPIFLLIIAAATYWIIVGMENRNRNDAARIAVQEQYVKINEEAPDTTEIDVVKVSPDKCKVLMDNPYVRVLEYTIAPGEKDNPHTHPSKSSYVVEGGRLRVFPENGQPFDAEERAGAVEWGDPVGKHYVENIGKTTVKILVTEVKTVEY